MAKNYDARLRALQKKEAKRLKKFEKKQNIKAVKKRIRALKYGGVKRFGAKALVIGGKVKKYGGKVKKYGARTGKGFVKLGKSYKKFEAKFPKKNYETTEEYHARINAIYQ